jgi:hypothetical protein
LNENTETDDPLLDSFRTKAYLPTEEFLNELHAQRCEIRQIRAEGTLQAK